MKISDILGESHRDNFDKYPYGRGIKRGDTIKHKTTGAEHLVTAVEGSKIALDDGTVVTPGADWTVIRRSEEKQK